MHEVVDARGLALRFFFPYRAPHQAVHPSHSCGADTERRGVEEQADGPRGEGKLNEELVEFLVGEMEEQEAWFRSNSEVQ